MKARSHVAAVLALTLTLNVPIAAHAQERESEDAPSTSPSSDWLVRAPAPIDLRIPGVTRTQLGDRAPLLSPFAPSPSGIRLSKGATTAIIVGAIVVGVLLIAGIVVLSKPGKLH